MKAPKDALETLASLRQVADTLGVTGTLYFDTRDEIEAFKAIYDYANEAAEEER